MKKTVKTKIFIKFKLALILFSAAVFLINAASCGLSSPSEAAIPGNLSNYGYVLVKGGDVYYTKTIVKSQTEIYSNIYKCGVENKNDETLISSMRADYINDMNAFMSFSGGYLYFLANFIDKSDEYSDNIYRIKPDGKNTEPEKLFDKNISCTFMYISNGTIYYYDNNDYAFYKVNTDGTKRQLLCEAITDCITVGNDKIYYAESERLMAVSLNGGNPEEIYNFTDDGIYIESLIFEGNYLYYINNDSSCIGRIKTDGTDKIKIYEVKKNSNTFIEDFNVSSGIVYFVLDEYGKTESYAVLSATPGDKSPKLIVSDENELGDIGPLSIWGDTIYFVGMPSYETIMDSDDIWFTVKKSGGNIEPFNPLNVFELQ